MDNGIDKDNTKEDTINSCFDYMLDKFGYDTGILIFGTKDSVYHVCVANLNKENSASILAEIAMRISNSEDIDE
jgi:hypothetical protein